MLEFQHVELKNVVYYREASLDLNYPGITTIYGDNRMTKSKVKKSNGSGKSLLLSAVPNLRYDALPVSGNLPRAKMRKEMLTDADSLIGLRLKTDETVWDFSKHSKGKSVEFGVLRNGKSPKVRRQGYAQELMAKQMPWTEEEFFSFIYLDSRRPAYIRFGTPASRMMFFTHLFGLDNYDDTRRRLKSMADGLKHDAKRIAAIEVELSGFAEDLDAQLETLKADQEYYQGELDIILPKMESLQSRIHSAATIAEQADNVKRLVDVCQQHGLRTYTEARILKLVDKLKAKRDDLKDAQRTLLTYREQLTTYKKWAARLSEAGHDGETYEEVSALYTKALEDIRTLEELLSEAEYAQHDAKAALKTLKAPAKVQAVERPDTKVEPERMASDLADFVAEHRQVKKDLRRVSDLLESAGDDCTCPTCDSQLNRKDLKNLVSSYKDKAVVLEHQIAELEALQAQVEEYTAYKAYKKDLAKYEEEQARLTAELEAAAAKVSPLKERLTKLLAHSDQWKTLRSLLKHPERKPKKVEGIDGLQEQLDSLNADIALLTSSSSLASIVSSLVDKDGNMLSNEALTANLPKLRKKYRQWVEYSQGIQADLVQNTTLVAECKANIKARNDLMAELEELKLGQADAPVYDMLLDAFGQKGIKMLILQSLCNRLQRTMNKYAPLLFSESFEFAFEVKSNTDFSIKVIRNSGKKQMVSDVRNLSGAEGRQFDYLFALSMLPMIPARRRANLIIFDEPCVNLDPSAKDLFYGSFLPKLNAIVPSIIVITNSLTSTDYNHRRVTVIKEKGFSRVEVQT